MSLATRCPACGTVFRVVQDQLKVSGGWVRCGQCHEVFNGLQTLFELPPDPPITAPEPSGPEATAPSAGLFVTREAQPPAPPPADAWAPTEPVALDEWASSDSTVDLADDPAPEEVVLVDPDAREPAPAPLPWAYRPQLAESDTSEAETLLPPEDEVAEAMDIEAAESEPPRVPVDPQEVTKNLPLASDSFVISQPPALPDAWPAWVDHEARTKPTSVIAGAPDEEPGPFPSLAGAQAQPSAETVVPTKVQHRDKPRRRSKRQRKPSFMRQAERAERWRSPVVRILMGSGSAVLGLMLALQVAHQQRDDLAARWPALREPLTAWCRVANCQLQAPRALASLTLDSSALSRTARPQVLRFEAELRNAAGHPVRPPALEVSFTDNLGHQLARKVFLPEQMAAPVEGLPPDRPWHIEVPLQVGDLQIAGFTAEVFYP